MSETMATNQTYVCMRAVSSTSSVGRYVCLSAPTHWDVFFAIKAFPHVSISNLQERPVGRITELLSEQSRKRKYKSFVISAAIARSSFNWNLK